MRVYHIRKAFVGHELVDTTRQECSAHAGSLGESFEDRCGEEFSCEQQLDLMFCQLRK